MGIFDAIGSFFKAIANVADLFTQRDAERNAPQMQANARAQTDAEIRAAATEAVAKQDTAAVERGLAE